MSSFQLPLFPLQAVLFPGGAMTLRIFEVRYLDLINRCEKEDAPFGLVCLSRGSEVQRAPRGEGAGVSQSQELHTVGTLAHITTIDRPQAGLMHIRCRGGRRFRLLGSEQMKHGLWIGNVEYLPDERSLPLPADLVHVSQALERLLQHLRAQAEGKGDPPIQPPYEWDDCAWVANRWCELLPVEARLKQQYLAVDSPLLRLELVADLLARLQIGTTSDGQGA